MSDWVRATLALQSNQYLNLTNNQAISPNKSIALFTLYSLPSSTISLTNETFSGIKSHKLIMVKDAQIMIITDSRFEDIRTPDLCKLSVQGPKDLNSVTSLINVKNVERLDSIKNSYFHLTLGSVSILNRFTDVKDVEISSSLFGDIDLFDSARLAIFQNYQLLEYRSNRLFDLRPIDSQS
jgi:hypothetical protein